jgi:chromosome segregation ATPase
MTDIKQYIEDNDLDAEDVIDALDLNVAQDDDRFDFDSFVEGMTIDALAESNDEVATLVEDKSELEDRVDVLEDKKKSLEDDIEELQSDLESYRDEERETLVDEITDLTSAWDEDSLLDEDIEELQTKKSIAEDAATSPSTPDNGSSDDTSNGNTETTTDSGSDDDGYTVAMEHRSWG